MNRLRVLIAVAAVVVMLGGFAAVTQHPARGDDLFPPELVDFVPFKGNPVFSGSAGDTWDRKIRERGSVMREGSRWYLWYTGYNPDRAETKFLGYATSPDGLVWTRHSDWPIFDQSWVEDMHVVRHGDTYFMVAEGRHDLAHLLTSKDRVHWKDHGRLDIRNVDGTPLTPGPRPWRRTRRPITVAV